MKRVSTFVFLLIVAAMTHAQPPADESRLMRNQDVIDMLKSSLGEPVIIAKIKNASTQFDTSTEAIKRLKEAGASDSLLVAMIEAKPKDQSLNTSQMPAPMKEALGKKKVYAESNDEEVRLQTLKRLKEEKFEVVDNPDQAELIFDFRVHSEAAVTYQPNIFWGGGVARSREMRACNLKVYLRSTEGRRLVFAKDIRSIPEESKFHALYNGDLPGIKFQIQILIDKYRKELKKAEKDR